MKTLKFASMVMVLNLFFLAFAHAQNVQTYKITSGGGSRNHGLVTFEKTLYGWTWTSAGYSGDLIAEGEPDPWGYLYYEIYFYDNQKGYLKLGKALYDADTEEFYFLNFPDLAEVDMPTEYTLEIVESLLPRGDSDDVDPGNPFVATINLKLDS